MNLEDYFDFDNSNGIRIKGTRVNIEIPIYETNEGAVPAQIAQNYPSLSLEQIHAALTYYYRHQQEIEQYIERQEAEFDEMKKEHEKGERPAVVQRLLKIKAERNARVAH